MSDLRGFTYRNVSLNKIKKDKFVLSKELEQQVDKEELKKKMSEVLDNNGMVYFICKKKEVSGVVVMKYEKHLANEFEFENDEKSSEAKDMGSVMMEGAIRIEDALQDKLGTDESKKEYAEQKQTANAYVLEDLYLSEELKAKEKIIMRDMIDILKEAASMNDLCVKVIIWGDTILADKTIGKMGGSESTAISLGMCIGVILGVILGIIFDNISLGICMGIAWGIALGCAIGAGYYGSANIKNKETNKETDKDTL